MEQSELRQAAEENRQTFERLQQMLRDVEAGRDRDQQQRQKPVVENDDFRCYWCQDFGHLKRHCKLYHNWRNSRVQVDDNKLNGKVDDDILSSGISSESSVTIPDVRVKVDFSFGADHKKCWIRVPNDKQTMLEFRRTICASLNCKFDDGLTLSVDNYEFLPDETIDILRDGDTVKCVLLCKKNKKTNSIGTQCKSLIKYSSRGIQCEVEVEVKRAVTDVNKTVTTDTECPKPVKPEVPVSKKKTDVATSSSGYRTVGKCGNLASDRPVTKQQTKSKSRNKSPQCLSSVDNYESDSLEGSDQSYYFHPKPAKSKSKLKVKSESKTETVKETDSGAVNCASTTVRPELWKYYDKLGWKIH